MKRTWRVHTRRQNILRLHREQRSSAGVAMEVHRGRLLLSAIVPLFRLLWRKRSVNSRWLRINNAQTFFSTIVVARAFRAMGVSVALARDAAPQPAFALCRRGGGSI
ncbi:MAG TPA: hypothetical protein VHD36_16730 [Pirellulales bacterium]|nr:hypothetical protein [Pirellulales bacterium]